MNAYTRPIFVTGGDAAALRLAPIVSRAAHGDQHAFTTLVEETQGLVCAIALAITHDIATSEDVAQDVFVDAWRGLAKLRNAASFLPWLRELTRNKARMAIRSAVRRRARVIGAADLSDDAIVTGAADARTDTLAQLVNAETAALLAESLAAVPESTREVLVLFYREGETVQHVAELLGTTEAAVRQRLSRARKTLRAEYLARAGEVIAGSAPGVLFVVSVSAAVAAAATAATPGIAAAATITTAVTTAHALTAKGALKAGALGAASAATTGMFAGALSGLTSINARVRKLNAVALDDEERRGIRRYAQTQVAGVLVFIGVMVFAPRALPVTVTFLLWLAVCWWQQRAYLPRITARRRAVERAQDPVAAAARLASDARAARLGLALATIGGGLPIALLWWRELSR